MAIFKPFQALRPIPSEASHVAALPYDIVTREEAAEIGRKEPHSFIHVDCAEIDLDADVDLYSAEVYGKAAENLRNMEEMGILRQDEKACYYIYQLSQGKICQTGLVGASSIDDYLSGVVKQHEFTRRDKEEDRIRHVETCSAQTGPIFLAYRSSGEIRSTLQSWKDSHEPVYDFTDDYGVRQLAWAVDDDSTIAKLREAFEQVPALYIADGHHRAAAAVKTGQKKRLENPSFTGEEPFNAFLAVAFPEDELTILPYNRVVSDLNGRDVRAFLSAVKFNFELMLMPAGFPCLPMERHCMGMYVDGQWYHLKAWDDVYQGKPPVQQLDVSILQEKILKPILGIEDPRSDSRICFTGEGTDLRELEAMADRSGGVAFVMFATSMEELMNIADRGEVMPPKSTWFTPKLRSGLFIQKI